MNTNEIFDAFFKEGQGDFAKQMDDTLKKITFATAVAKLLEDELEERGGLVSGSITFNFCATKEGVAVEADLANLDTEVPTVYNMVCNSIRELLQGHMDNYSDAVVKWINSIIEEEEDDD